MSVQDDVTLSEEEEQTWEMTCGVCKTHGAEGLPVYGVRVYTTYREWTFEDVDASPARVEVLLQRLRRAQPPDYQWEYIVRDFIENDGE